MENVYQVLPGEIRLKFIQTSTVFFRRELAKKTLGMSGQFSTDNINLVIKKSPLAMSSMALTAPITTKQKSAKPQAMESIVDNEIERDGLRIPKKIDSTWAVSKVLLQKKGKVALKDLRRFNDLTSENQRGLNRQRKVSIFLAYPKCLSISFGIGNHFFTRCEPHRR